MCKDDLKTNSMIQIINKTLKLNNNRNYNRHSKTRLGFFGGMRVCVCVGVCGDAIVSPF